MRSVQAMGAGQMGALSQGDTGNVAGFLTSADGLYGNFMRLASHPNKNYSIFRRSRLAAFNPASVKPKS